MTKIDIVQSVAHSGKDMFALVIDIESYPDFLPSCRSLVLQSSEQRDDYKIHKAYMVVGGAKINRGFTSQVIEDSKNLKVSIKSDDPIFRYMRSHWSFIDTNEGCEINFSTDYEFTNRALSILMNGIFDKMFKSIVTAFKERADSLYT